MGRPIQKTQMSSARMFIRYGAQMYAFAFGSMLGQCVVHPEGGALFLCLRSLFAILAGKGADLKHRTRAELVGRLTSAGVCCLLSALFFCLIVAAVGGALVLVTSLAMVSGQWIDRISIRKRHTARKWLGQRVLLAALVCGLMGMLQLAALPLFLSYCVGAGLDMAAAYASLGGREEAIPRPVAKRWPGITSAYTRLERPLQMAGGIGLVRLGMLDGLEKASLAETVASGAACLLTGYALWSLVLRMARSRWWTERCQMAAGLLMWGWGTIATLTDSWRVWLHELAPYARLSVCLAGLAVCMTTLAQMRSRLACASRPQGLPAQRAGEDGLWRGGLVALLCLACVAVREPLSRLVPAWTPDPALTLADGAHVPHDLKVLSAGAAAVRLMLVPSLVWMGIAFIRALRYPMDARYERKLRLYETLIAQGGTNEGLRKELEQTLEKPYAYRWGIRLLALALRLFMPHRILGGEHLARAEAGDAVLLCNHSELYGPIAAYLSVPFPTRPWTDDRVADKERAVEHMNRYTLSRQDWLPLQWRMPLARGFLAPVLHWAMTSVNGIPVYRDHPAALVKTFRASIAALRAGDTLLIFPENPDDPSLEKAGYLRQGVGPWFSGIGALGHLHFRQTGNPLLFVPMYASKRSRTLSVGEPEIYDGHADPRAEGERLVQVLHARTVELARSVGDMLPPVAGSSSVAL